MKKLAYIAIATSFVAAQNINLDTIVVTATKSEQKIQNVTSNITVITKEELQEKHITTVADALKDAPGLIVSQSGGLGAQTSIFLRGFDSDSTLVLVNGVKVNNPTTIGGQADIANLILGDVERIEIIKGAQSGIYGANAAAGVINIITKKATKEFEINSNLEYGTYNTKQAQLSLSKKYGNLSAYLSYNYLKTDGFSAQADIEKDVDSFEDDGYENKTFNANISYKFTDNDKLELQYTNIDADVDYDKSLTEQDGYNMTEDDYILNTSFTHKYSDNSYSRVYYTKSKFLKKDPKGWTPRFEGNNQEYGIDNKVTFEKLDVLFGLNRTKSKDIVNDRSLKSTGAYVTGNLKLNNTIFSATLRRDNYSEFKDKTTGKIGIKHIFENGLVISSNYGTAYRVPSLFEYSLNQNLKPESTKGFDIGFEYKNFYVTYFNNNIDDEIVYDTSLWNYNNSDKSSKIKGFEVGYKGVITQDIMFNLNYTRYDGKDKDGKQLLRRPTYIANASLDYYGFANTHINFNAQYIGKRLDNDYSTFPATKVNTGNIFIANLALDYKINDKVSAYLKIDNITDKKYQNVYGYATSGRAFYVGINAKF